MWYEFMQKCASMQQPSVSESLPANAERASNLWAALLPGLGSIVKSIKDEESAARWFGRSLIDGGAGALGHLAGGAAGGKLGSPTLAALLAAFAGAGTRYGADNLVDKWYDSKK